MRSILCVSLLVLLMSSSAYAELPGASADGFISPKPSIGHRSNHCTESNKVD